MPADSGMRPIDDRLWNVIDATVRRLPAARDKGGAVSESLKQVESENRASSRAEKTGAEDASRAIELLKDKVVTYSEDSRPTRTGEDNEKRIDVKG